MYSTHNDGKSVVAERSIKIKPADVKPSTYIDFKKEEKWGSSYI